MRATNLFYPFSSLRSLQAAETHLHRAERSDQSSKTSSQIQLICDPSSTRQRAVANLHTYVVCRGRRLGKTGSGQYLYAGSFPRPLIGWSDPIIGRLDDGGCGKKSPPLVHVKSQLFSFPFTLRLVTCHSIEFGLPTLLFHSGHFVFPISNIMCKACSQLPAQG